MAVTSQTSKEGAHRGELPGEVPTLTYKKKDLIRGTV